MKSIRIYVASPLGFAESTGSYLSELVSMLKRHHYEVLDPWSPGYDHAIADALSEVHRDERLAKLEEANRRVAETNERSIRSCDCVVAVLDGVDVDSGTASEVGFAYALGKRILGLRSDFRKTGDNEAAIVNLQVQYWIDASGGFIVRSLKEAEAALALGFAEKPGR